MRYALQNVYIIWIAISTAGLLQVLASYYGWDGLSFFRGRRRLGYVCGTAAVPLSYIWFFTLQNRNVPGLEGWQLFSRFALGAVAGIIGVLVLSSALNASMARPPLDGPASPLRSGLDGLRYDTYLRLLRRLMPAADNKGEGH
jgi:hypothetical protein